MHPRLSGTSAFSPITLSEAGVVPNTLQVLRAGKFSHPQYGEFEITPLILAEMKANYDSRVRGIDLSFDYYHESGNDASAWVKALTLSEDGTELWATVDWTPRAQKKLAERELRYFSPDFSFKWKDPESGKVFKNVLFGGGLTNRPFVKEMQAIVASENKGIEMTELEKLQAANLKLSEEKAALETKLAAVPPPPAEDEVAALKKQIAELQAALAKAQGDKEIMAAENAKYVEEKQLAEKETAFVLLLTEGKACAAQKSAFIKGDMNEFIKLAQPLNLKGTGSVEGGDNVNKDDQILKLAEEKRKADPKLDFGTSVSLAKKELK